jgi:hypothetical protein
MNIVPPVEFRNAVRNINPGIQDIVHSMDDFVQIALIGVGAHEGSVIRQFVEGVLAAKPDADALKEFWLSTPASLFFHDGDDVRTFLQALADRLSHEPYVLE